MNQFEGKNEEIANSITNREFGSRYPLEPQWGYKQIRDGLLYSIKEALDTQSAAHLKEKEALLEKLKVAEEALEKISKFETDCRGYGHPACYKTAQAALEKIRGIKRKL